ncbi:OmpW/AlkL family protein [Pseudoxanthomonas sp.]|jgi:outer membrane protein|uniref:OmpW/AlkL family protein n=1 Tax=Pseudoxanthomonas sp. TaxID=1871049 RepID=UPI002E0F8541|nr:OmpW family outer membrane protein [Pseudoxanthomonas sp.]
MKSTLVALSLLLTSPTCWATEDDPHRFAATIGYASQSGESSLIPVQLGDGYPPGSEIERGGNRGSAAASISWYMTPRVALELWGKGSSESSVEIDVENGPDVGVARYSTRHASLSVQYHFLKAIDGERIVATPFVGVGYGKVSVSNVSSNAQLGYGSLEVEGSNGLALVLGMDLALGERWFLRGDARRLTWTGTSTLQAARLTDEKQNLLIYGVSLGRRF